MSLKNPSVIYSPGLKHNHIFFLNKKRLRLDLECQRKAEMVSLVAISSCWKSLANCWTVTHKWVMSELDTELSHRSLFSRIIIGSVRTVETDDYFDEQCTWTDDSMKIVALSVFISAKSVEKTRFYGHERVNGLGKTRAQVRPRNARKRVSWHKDTCIRFRLKMQLFLYRWPSNHSYPVKTISEKATSQKRALE